MRGTILPIALILASTVLGTRAFAQSDQEHILLEVTGRVTDGDKKLAGCEVTVYQGNEVLGTQTTGKNGHYGFAIPLGGDYAVVFRREGFQPKSILIDTRAKLPADMFAVAPVGMDMSLLASTKYEGVDIDVLDFPYAIIRWNKREMSFTPDKEYTTSMMRTNGALLLQSGRATKE